MIFIKKTSWRQVFGGFWLVASSLWGEQTLGQSNQWINSSQVYYKIPVAATGIYKITYSDLQGAGVPVTGIDPRKINLIHRGTEQAIFIQGESDAVFDPADYIEFFGMRNDGTLDADLYAPGLQPHPYYNLFTDTTAYFLTWNPLPIQGKRMTSFFETNSSSLPVEASHMEERLIVYTTEYSGGLTVQGEIQSTAFDAGEGWTGPSICRGTSGCTAMSDLLIDNLLRGVTSAGNPQLEILLVGRDDLLHQLQIYVGANSGTLRLVNSSSFNGFDNLKVNVPLAWSDIGVDGKMTVRVQLVAGGLRDLLSVSYIKVSFPQSFSVNSQTEKQFGLAANPTNKSYVEFSNVPAATRIWDITDSNSVGMIGFVPIAGGIASVVPSTGSPRKLYAASATRTVTLRKVSFRAIIAPLHNFLIISNRALMKPALGYGDAVQAYAAYRASAAGGSYDTLSVPVDQLYNQFNYGETSPRAIYQFMKYMVNGGKPKFLFLIGKGLEVSQGFYRKTSFAPTDLRDLVPSAGMPGADMAFTAGLNGTTSEPALPTGRLTASTAIQVAAYLNKVKETEALSFNELWRKDLLHLSGGINPGEPEIFRSFVDGFKAVAEGNYLGGKTSTISKQTLNVELINVKDQVNKGLNLITFFGHSGPGTIDIDIGYASDPTLGYNNAGKYPGFLINGCNAGRFFDNRVTFGEDWILTPNKGAKSFIAHSFFGFSGTLRQYSDIFYQVAFGDSVFLRKGIGEVQKETARRYQAISGSGIISTTQVQQMVLLGDPAVSLFGAARPDYEVNNSAVSIVSLDGKPVTAQTDSFAFEFRVRNFGRSESLPLKVKIQRSLDDNSVITYDSIYNPVLYSETYRFIIRQGRSSAGFGNNNFSLMVDPDNVVKELNETNNGASLNFFIPLNGTRNLFPAPYAIVPADVANLVFQNTDLLASASRTFKVEIDTASTFDSPYLQKHIITGQVIGKTQIKLLPDDSLVYYWRTKFEKPLAGESTEWTTSSFVRIEGSPEGWSQSKFPQLLEDPTTGLMLDEQVNRVKFLETISSVDVKTFGSASGISSSQVSLKINHEEFNVATQNVQCRNNTLNLIAFDKSSTAPYAGVLFPSFFDLRACGRAPKMINSFGAGELDTGAGNDLTQYVMNMGVSDSVVLFSIGDGAGGYPLWNATIKSQLAQLGISDSQISTLQPGEPFIIYGKKGAPAGSAKVIRPAAAPANAQTLIASRTVTGRFSEGILTSTLIGPAQQWSRLVVQAAGVTGNDQYGFDVIGVDLNGNETTLKTQIRTSQSISDVNAATYPYIKLRLDAIDQFDLTPVQLQKWIVTFLPKAEGILSYAGLKQVETLSEGQDWKANYGFTNISSRAFQDSLTVKVDIFTNETRAVERQTFKIKPPVPGDTSKFPVTVKTKNRPGPNDIIVSVNPHIVPELYYDNNVVVLYGHVNATADKTGPVLDMTVDGRHLRNGDAVSSSPTIITKVVDRNRFLLKTDTSGINLYLRYPCLLDECPYKRIAFSRPDVTWKPATSTTEFEIDFKPASLPPGEYAIRAEAVDASGNTSGKEPYEVSFVVDEKNSFSLRSVSPNPSSDQFFFDLIFSGPDAPQDFQLDIYSSTGGLIRSFGAGAADLRVGFNRLAVGATDANGNLLPVGIYLFRMRCVTGGRESNASGRLVVVR
jgi:hypothetical protein